MSRQSDERKFEKKGLGKPKLKGGIFPYKPSKEHADDMKTGGYSLEDAITDIQHKLEDRCGATFGYNVDRDGYYAIIRDAAVEFGQNVSVSCWGGSLAKAILGLGYYVHSVNPDFPDGVQLEFPQLADW